ncbi:hypothetical protein GCM10010417_06700 [Streptomyces carpaticus]
MNSFKRSARFRGLCPTLGVAPSPRRADQERNSGVMLWKDLAANFCKPAAPALPAAPATPAPAARHPARSGARRAAVRVKAPAGAPAAMPTSRYSSPGPVGTYRGGR